MRWLVGLITVALIGGALLVLLPAPIDPVTWEPDPNPGLTGPYAPNNKLAQVQHLLDGVGVGPEDVSCGADGEMYTGLDDGRILRFDANGDYQEVANTGGRPLGIHADVAGNLIVADAIRGLLAVSASGDVKVLTDSVGGKKMRFVDDLDVAADGTVWFSDASARFGYDESMYDFLDGRPTGRLLSYDPTRQETRVHLDNLFFANGVALGPNDDYVLVNETITGRIHRVSLKGRQFGKHDVFKSELPGTPDNISFNGRDTFWVAMPSLRAPIDASADKPWLRKLMSRLPNNLIHMGSTAGSYAIGLDLQGNVKYNLQDPDAGYHMITSVNECGDSLFLGSVLMQSVARLPLEVVLAKP